MIFLLLLTYFYRVDEYVMCWNVNQIRVHSTLYWAMLDVWVGKLSRPEQLCSSLALFGYIFLFCNHFVALVGSEEMCTSRMPAYGRAFALCFHGRYSLIAVWSYEYTLCCIQIKHWMFSFIQSLLLIYKIIVEHMNTKNIFSFRYRWCETTWNVWNK